MFSLILDGVIALGITTIFRCISHLRIICAGVASYFLAKPSIYGS